MKMRTKITIGFAIVIALLLGVSILAIVQFSAASEGFTQYRGLARDTNLAGRLQANMLMVRMNVKDFIITGSDKDHQQYQEYLEKMNTFLEEAQIEIQSPERAALVDKVDENVLIYEASFKDVLNFKLERDDHVKNYLDVQGPFMENTLTDILISAKDDADDIASFHAALTLKHLLLARLYMAKFLDSNDDAAVNRVHEEMSKMEDNIIILDNELENTQRREHLAAVRKAKKIYLDNFDEVVSIIRERNNVITNSLDVIGPEIAGYVEEVKLSIKADQDALGPVLQAANDRANIIIIIISIIATIIGIFMAFYTVSSILKQLGADPAEIDKITREVALGNLNMDLDKDQKNNRGVYLSVLNMMTALDTKAKAVAIVASGDLTIDINLASSKDVLGASLIKMTDSLNSLLGQVNMSVDQVNIGADQVSQASQSLSQGATESASSLEEVSASITQINSQSRQNAENATEANGLAKQATEDAEKGNKEMEGLSVAMEKINKSSDQIKKIVKVIDDIAFQTNLLALNANVEAARAGKYGKGFAVVADEVRNLAVRSAEAVKETTDMVDESIKNIESGNKAVESTATQLGSIMGGVSKVADFLEEIATASKEQAEAIDQITQGLEQIDQVTQSNTASAEESAAAAEELASQSMQLKNMVATFKLKNTQNIPGAQPTRQLEYQSPKETIQLPHAAGKNGETGIKQVDPPAVISLDDDDFDRF
jgi:methyl-accepting chemotaxis protein